jgi:hypothetical protein
VIIDNSLEAERARRLSAVYLLIRQAAARRRARLEREGASGRGTNHNHDAPVDTSPAGECRLYSSVSPDLAQLEGVEQ